MVQKESRPRGRPRSYDPDTALDDARRAFWNTGYAATSLDDLSAATGLNRPSLYGAFGDKKALYLAALERSRAETVTALTAALAPDEPLRASLSRVYEATTVIYMRGDAGPRGCFLVGTAVTEAVDDPDIRRVLGLALSEIDAVFEARLRRAASAGDPAPSSDLAGLAKVATSVMNAMAIRARAGAEAEVLSAMGVAAVDLLCGAQGR